MFETEANWAFKTVPQPALNNAEVAQPRGKVIGGSAAINIGSWSSIGLRVILLQLLDHG